MSFLQTKELLERLHHCSQRLADGYEELGEETRHPIVSALFRRAKNQEQRLVDSLQSYINVAPDRVLSVWFQSPCLHPLKDAVREVESAEIHEREAALELMCLCEQAWASVCKHLSNSTLSRDVQELFQHLYLVRLQGGRDIMWQSAR